MIEPACAPWMARMSWGGGSVSSTPSLSPNASGLTLSAVSVCSVARLWRLSAARAREPALRWKSATSLCLGCNMTQTTNSPQAASACMTCRFPRIWF
jgi:hypothetical protein